MDINEIVRTLDNFAWGPVLVFLCLVSGIFFSVLMKFPQIRMIDQMVSNLFGGKNSKSGLTPFQSFSIALGGRVGTGTITGTAGAILMGGPGSIFWMCVMTLFGSMSALIESVLAQTYKERVKDEYVGGPAFYIEKGLKWKPLGVVYAIYAIIFLIIFTALQANSFTSVASVSFNVQPIIIGTAYVVLLALVIFGGFKRIGKVAEIIVPFMSAGYILLAIIMFAVNYTEIISVFAMIFKSAFGLDAAFGGLVGSSISWGVKRGIFSNEAGLGTGAMVAGTAEVSHPAKAGFAQAFSTIVTIFICLATAFMIFSASSFNVENPNGGFLIENVPGVASGEFTATAISNFIPGFGGIFITIAMFLFTFTTILAYVIYIKSNVVYLLRGNIQGRKYNKIILTLNIFILAMAFVGPLVSADLVWNLGSALCGFLAMINTICILLLTKKGVLIFKDYEKQLKKGVDPIFIPSTIGIKNAELWDEITAENYSEEVNAYNKAFNIHPKDSTDSNT
ncbi:MULTISPECIES: sodium:alanine symporter family protein [unclassified Sporosarcina]|uniref:alanine/glycine:cation symporter family protein n=1 Tax=unclassified Sporosarcina TaxID=2647733 RepID=UPI00203D61AC|nr:MULTISPECIES: alanine/glycine:cation symporter family protein [unclassified Sporosarcina]GKV65131.1 putative sodium/proton-dependent alanine carrier protein YrbD [Sporosarcina sp. NCCP-2331]GLB55255.1 putative sodium/proton-dependent alanine carrier protein YrbD [Sporosarcina sp. NCCP-2378]